MCKGVRDLSPRWLINGGARSQINCITGRFSILFQDISTYKNILHFISLQFQYIHLKDE